VQRTKRQHYVPQFLLRHFASPSDRIWCFDKLKREIRLQGVRDSAHETQFYDNPDVAKKGINLEKTLADFEGKVAPILKEIVGARSLLSLDLDLRVALVDFTLVQLFRTRASASSKHRQ